MGIWSVCFALISAALSLGASYILAGPARISDKEIEEISATKFDGNPDFKKKLLRDRRDAQQAWVLIALSMTAQALSIISSHFNF